MTYKLIDRKLKVLLIALILSASGCASAENESPRKCDTPQGMVYCQE